jgi:hypothetical protein
VKGARLGRLLRRVGVALLVLVVLAAIPIVYVETRCSPSGAPAAEYSPYAITDPDYRRAEGDSYLTYPEWYIVHAYADLAGVTRQSSESSFDYLSSATGFWKSLCRATIAAGHVGPVTADQKTTNYIIGLSFTGEMAVIGAYERTIGALTAWLRGKQRTAEDEFALKVADDYAAFLQQTPWYQYPFFPTLARFWRETPFGDGNIFRSAERRLALTLEYGGKGLYAIPIGALAGVSPADLTIRSVVTRLTDDDLASDSRIKKIRDVGNDATLIETPRYQEFTDIARRLGAHGRYFFEIAGNQHILTTILAPEGATIITPNTKKLFVIPLQSRPGWLRIGLDTKVEELASQIGFVEKQGAKFEHAYDY